MLKFAVYAFGRLIIVVAILNCNSRLQWFYCKEIVPSNKDRLSNFTDKDKNEVARLRTSKIEKNNAYCCYT